MKHFERIQKAINFIEENLDHQFSLEDVSKEAFCSLSYMHRIFYQITGITIKEYIRKRRLSQAAVRLQKSKDPVIDIALCSGYETLESFSRGFKHQFSMTPRACRNKHDEVPLIEKLDLAKEYQFISPPELDFNLSLESISHKALNLTGFQIHTTLDNNQQATDICRFADHMIQGGIINKHFDLTSSSMYGVYTNMTDQNNFDYTLACLEKSCVLQDNMMVKIQLPASRYAKFTLDRNDRIKEAWHYIYGHWFPQIEPLRSKGFDFEIYHKNTVSIYIPMNIVPTKTEPL